MGGLASAVEMSKSGLFAHFGSKQELQLATVARRLGDLERQTSALESAVRAANESGELRVRKEPRETAFALHSILVNANSLFIVHGDPRVFDHARATIGDLLGEPRAVREG